MFPDNKIIFTMEELTQFYINSMQGGQDVLYDLVDTSGAKDEFIEDEDMKDDTNDSKDKTKKSAAKTNIIELD